MTLMESRNHNRFGWIGCLVLTLLVASCQPYEDVHEAKADPNEASFAVGTLNGDPWEANTQVGLHASLHVRKGKILFGINGILEFDSELYWDDLFFSDIPWIRGIFKIDLNKDRNADVPDEYHVVEYDVSVARYQLDKTQPNYLKLCPMWGTADYTGELEVHLVKISSVEYAPPTPDTLHLVVDDFRASRLK